ncbi:MAG: hypothetical protein EB023_09955, partial [Flavobacteriia bacterium]|nr:hypothetical protein [Flavobacteriia bacterium]
MYVPFVAAGITDVPTDCNGDPVPIFVPLLLALYQFCRRSRENHGVVVIRNRVGTLVEEGATTIELSRYRISGSYLERKRGIESVIERNVV